MGGYGEALAPLHRHDKAANEMDRGEGGPDPAGRQNPPSDDRVTDVARGKQLRGETDGEGFYGNHPAHNHGRHPSPQWASSWQACGRQQNRAGTISLSRKTSKAFDCFHVDRTSIAAARWGAAVPWLRTLSRFCSDQKKLFASRGHVDKDWLRAKHGHIQGCSYNSVMMAYAMLDWTTRVQETSVLPTTYMDDRTMATWRTENSHRRDLVNKARAALVVSDNFDKDHGLVINSTKSVTASSWPNNEEEDEGIGINEMPCNRAEEVKTLGVIIHMITLRIRLAKYDADKARMRLQRIAWAIRDRNKRGTFARTLVLPAAFWLPHDQTTRTSTSSPIAWRPR